MMKGTAENFQEREREPYVRELPGQGTVVARVTCALCGQKIEVTSVTSHMNLQHPAKYS